MMRANEQEELRSIVNHIDEFAQQLTDGIETLDWIDKREVIRALVKRVEISKEDVRVVYKIGQLPFVPGPASGASSQDCLWRDNTALGRTGIRVTHATIFHYASFQPLVDQT